MLLWLLLCLLWNLKILLKMNKIYFHKYCHITHSVKVVSELAKKRSRGRRKLSTLLLLNIVTFIPAISSASVVGNDVSYQTYRDFAENKGQFSVGAERIHVLTNRVRVLVC